jgi:simple sugar transport system ATP-binding protein
MADTAESHGAASRVNETPILELRNITKRFGGLIALSDVSIKVHEAEVVAIMGDNGAGKSTLMKVVAGVHAPSSGELLLRGVPKQFSTPIQSRAEGIEVVYQDLALANVQTVYMNMFLGRELTKRGPFLDKRRMRDQTTAILQDLDIQVPSVTIPVLNLSGGQRQGLAIGRATHWAERLVLLDEPTAALGLQETARVEQSINRMRDRGLAVLIVSHNLDQVFRLADRIYVLRRGELTGERSTKETTGDEIVTLITGSKATAVVDGPGFA